MQNGVSTGESIRPPHYTSAFQHDPRQFRNQQAIYQSSEVSGLTEEAVRRRL